MIQVPPSSDCEVDIPEWTAKRKIKNFPGGILVNPEPRVWGVNGTLLVLGQGSLRNKKSCKDLEPFGSREDPVFECDFKQYAIGALLRVGMFPSLTI